MFFYEVLVASPRYHKSSALTYSSPSALSIGMIIVAPMQKQIVLAVVTAEVKKPVFKVKKIERSLGVKLPRASLELLNWFRSYYPAPLGIITSLFLPQFLLATMPDKETPAKPKKAKTLPALTIDQA